MIHNERLRILNPGDPAKGDYLLYWMQASQRVHCNHALQYAIRQANDLGLPIMVGFGLTGNYPGANYRHYHFMLEGLIELRQALKDRNIRFIIKLADPVDAVVKLAENAALVVTDRGYTRQQKFWRQDAAGRLPCPLIQVESDVIFPVDSVSHHEEYAARTIRPKIQAQLDNFLVPLEEHSPRKSSLNLGPDEQNWDTVEDLLNAMNIDRSVKPVPKYHGGTSHALARLADFLNHKLSRYEMDRNDPAKNGCSELSPYLHFGHISPLHVALEAIRSGQNSANTFLEELIVRRELSVNYVHFNPKYDSFQSLPAWARATLKEHAKDTRPYLYSFDQLEQAQTHDPYWNAAQNEMRFAGKMHGYMRMYWGKKIIEWSRSPRIAFETAIQLNDKYELDGRDPNGYTGVAWCFGKHDRPWVNRPVIGCLRYMNENGLRRKFDADAYVKQVNALKED